jgi:hypothetical protein
MESDAAVRTIVRKIAREIVRKINMINPSKFL